MKKFFICVLTLLMLLSFSMFAVSCQDSNDNVGEQPTVESVTLSATSLRMVLGDKYKLDAVYSLEDWVDFDWVSSDSAVATVDNNGMVTTLSLGKTTVTATYFDVFATCEIEVVMDNQVPNLYVKHSFGNEINAVIDGEYQLDYAVSFNGNIFEDAEFTFESSNPELLTVSKNGLVTAKSKTETPVTITVKGSWYGNEYSTLIDVIEVNVIEDVRILVNGGETSKVLLYTIANHNGQTFDTIKEFDVTVEYNGATLSENEYSIEVVGDQTVATYKDGLVTAIKGGETQIKISYKDYYKLIPVEVTFPITEYKNGPVEFSAYDGVLDLDEIFGKKDVQLVKAYQDDTELVVENNKISGLKLNWNQITKTKITVVSELEGFIVEVNAAAHIVEDAEDLQYFNVTAEMRDNNICRTGYVYLKNDIVAEEALAHPGVRVDGYSTACTFGFAGVLDGQGHTITAPITKAGFLGAICANKEKEPMEVKNIGFDLTATVNGSAGIAYLRGKMSSNIRMNFNDVYLKVSGNIQSYTGIVWYNSYCINYNNVIMDYTDLKATSGSSFGQYDSYIVSGSVAYRTNIHIISSLSLGTTSANNSSKYRMPKLKYYGENKIEFAPEEAYTYDSTKQVEFNENQTYKHVAKGVHQYATAEEFIEAGIDYSAFNTEIWEFITGIPTFKTDPYVLKVGTSSVGPYTIIKGETAKITLRDNGAEVPFTATSNNPAVATVNGNIINGNANGTANITITYDYQGKTINKVLPVSIGQIIEVDGTFDFSANDGDLPLEQIFGTTNVNITSAWLGNEQLTVQNNKIVGLYTPDNDILDATVMLFTTSDTYKVNLRAYRQIIDETGDLMIFNQDKGKTSIIKGYYILANDIDLDADIDPNTDGVQKLNLTHNATMDGTIETSHDSSYGFAGTFDGNGYKIYGKAPENSLFRAMLPHAKICNVAFDVEISNQCKILLAWFASTPLNSQRITLSDIYVKLRMPAGVESITEFKGLFGTTLCYVDATNLFIDMTEVKTTDYCFAFSSWLRNDWYTNNFTIVVGNITKFAGRYNAFTYLAKNQEFPDGVSQGGTLSGTKYCRSGSGSPDVSAIYVYDDMKAILSARPEPVSYTSNAMHNQYMTKYWQLTQKTVDGVTGYVPVWVGNGANA